MANYAVRLPRPNQDISPLKGRGELKNKRKQKKKKAQYPITQLTYALTWHTQKV